MGPSGNPNHTYLTPPVHLIPILDSAPGAFPAGSHLNWSMYLMVLRSCTFDKVIVCGRGSLTVRYGHHPLWKSLVRQGLFSYGCVGNIDWKACFGSRYGVVYWNGGCEARDHRVWVEITFGIVLSVIQFRNRFGVVISDIRLPDFASCNGFQDCTWWSDAAGTLFICISPASIASLEVYHRNLRSWNGWNFT